MRKWLLSLAVILASAGLLMWAGSAVMEMTMARQVEREWPLGLGTIRDVPKRYPRAAATVAAQRLRVLTQRLEQSTPEHALDLDAIRALLISGSPVGWEQNLEVGPMAPVPELAGQMALSRLLEANALARARLGEASAWDDLRAIWMLHRNLLERPEMISVLTGVAGASLVNAAARKMPLPEPEWFIGLERHDYRRAMLAAFQAEAWTISQMVSIETTTDTDPDDPAAAALGRARDILLTPYMRLSASDEADRWRRMAFDIAASTECDLDLSELVRSSRASIPAWNLPARAMADPNLVSMWKRVSRLRCEIEASRVTR